MATKTTQRPAGKGQQQQHRGQQPQPVRTGTRPPQQEEKNPIARMGTSDAPARIRQREGKAESVSKDASDNQVPFIYLLQSNSPQVMKGHEKYIPGAEASNIWLRNDPEPLIDGERGMDFQCCYFSKDWVEWLPERAGLAGRHPDKPEDAFQDEEEGEDGGTKTVWKRSNGNYLVETRYHVGLVYRKGKPPEPYTLPLSSTGHTISKQWTTAQNKLEGGRVEWYDVIWTLHVVLKRKGPHAWYQYEVAFNRYCTDDEAEEGKNLHDAFKTGTKRMEDDEPNAGGEGAGDAERSDVM